jgi:phosphoglycerate kinase
MSEINLINQTNLIPLSEIKNSKVLVRVGFDIPNNQDLARIEDSVPTIKQLLTQNNSLILVTKWGKVKTEEDKVNFSTINLIDSVKKVFENNQITNQVVFVDQFKTVLEERLELLENKKIILYENCHFNDSEKSDDSNLRLNLAEEYCEGMDYYVDECFISSHRQEATNTEIKDVLPWSYGISYLNEKTSLDKLRLNPKQPYIVIMGGAKLETKLPLINKMLSVCDKILVGGLLCFTFLKAGNNLGFSNVEICDSFVQEDYLEIATELLRNNANKIILPVDLVYEFEGDKKFGRDIGVETILLYKEILKDSQTVFWNGPMGFFEKKPFDIGTREIAEFLTTLETSYRVLGGGDTNTALGESLLKKFNFVSMAGGASLEYLSK